jgi:yecA family protein
MFQSGRSRSFMAHHSRNMETPALLPPKVSEFGHQAFSVIEQESLARWLQEPAWPRGTLNIYALEGYLTALLVWPVALRPGAWLPPVWNEEGWKVRPPIDTVQRYGEFLELVLGYLRKIDRGLLQTPSVFEPSLHLSFSHGDLDRKGRAQHWAQGFGRGLQQSVQARLAPTLDARAAVRTIAAYAAGQPGLSRKVIRRAGIDLTRAVLALADTRISRGPLGELPKKTVTAQPTTPQSHESAGPINGASS